jgi:hypothetical protein
MSRSLIRLSHGRSAVSCSWTQASLYLLSIAALIALQAIVLYALGQPPICTCGTIRLWVGNVLGPENSQQIIDW